jgi:hypothetical protein
MKLGTETSNLVNHLLSRAVRVAPTPQVGMGATLLYWSDRSPATIMTIQQAARWAKSKGVLYAVRNGEPEYLYAVFDLRTYLVECVGYHNKCCRYMDLVSADARESLRMQCLEEVAAELDEAASEQLCLPSARALAWGCSD